MPSLERHQVRELTSTSFVEQAQNVMLLGPPNVGKAHLAIGLGMKAVEAGYSMLVLSWKDLITRLMGAKHENRLERAFRQLVYPKVLIRDELDYLPHSRDEARLFFRLVVRRNEQASLNEQQKFSGLG